MKAYRGAEVYLHAFLISALDMSSASPTGCFTAGKRALGTHWIGGWVGPRAGVEILEKR